MELNSVLMQHIDINEYDSESSESDDTVYSTTPPTHVYTTASEPQLINNNNREYNRGSDTLLGLSPPTASRLLQRRSQERREQEMRNGLHGAPIIQLAH